MFRRCLLPGLHEQKRQTPSYQFWILRASKREAEDPCTVYGEGECGAPSFLLGFTRVSQGFRSMVCCADGKLQLMDQHGALGYILESFITNSTGHLSGITNNSDTIMYPTDSTLLQLFEN